jgi:uncharacterized protein (TIGR04255 family)
MSEPLEGPYGPVDEWDLPLGGLPRASRIKFDRTHMEAAVAEVRFVSEQVSLDRSVAAHVWEALGPNLFPMFEPSRQVLANIELGPDGAEVPSQRFLDGWLLATVDGDTAVTLLPTGVVVQTRKYHRYSTSLGEPLAKVLAAFTEATGLAHIQRLGLRYVNRLTDQAATSPQHWHDHVREQFRGPLEGPLGGLVINVHQQAEFRLDATTGARVQTGAFEDQNLASPEPLYSYLIDLDVFREQASTYDPLSCSDQVRQLNRTALSVFGLVLTDQYLSDLGPVAVPPPAQTADAHPTDAIIIFDDDLEEDR